MQHHEVVRRQISVVEDVGIFLRLDGFGRVGPTAACQCVGWVREDRCMRPVRSVEPVCRGRGG